MDNACGITISVKEEKKGTERPILGVGILAGNTHTSSITCLPFNQCFRELFVEQKSLTDFFRAG